MIDSWAMLPGWIAVCFGFVLIGEPCLSKSGPYGTIRALTVDRRHRTGR